MLLAKEHFIISGKCAAESEQEGVSHKQSIDVEKIVFVIAHLRDMTFHPPP